MVQLKDKVAIITGGSRGIGKAIAHAYADEGCKIVLVGRSREALKLVENELLNKGTNVISIICDVTEEAQVQEMVDVTLRTFGSVDILVNNAGSTGPTASIEEITTGDWDKVISSNLKGPFLCCKAVVPTMKKNQRGRIINISSISGKRPLPYRTGYCTSKMGVLGFTRTLAAELGPNNITVNSICPGFVTGERITNVIAKQADARGLAVETIENEFKQSSPLNRLTTAEDVAATAVFLAADHSLGITGEDINVSSGVVMY